jgi:hypothetical protein
MTDLSPEQATQVEKSLHGDTCLAHKILEQLSPQDRMVAASEVAGKTKDLFLAVNLGALDLDDDIDPEKLAASGGIPFNILQKTDTGMNAIYTDGKVPESCKTGDGK